MIGFVNINKPSGISSGAVVSQIKKLINISRVGHLGTLDPMACGVLPIAIGKATRMFDYFLDKEKSYIAVFEFGYKTDTLDKTGQLLETTKKIPTLEQIKKILPKQMGEISQMPPQYSAKSVGGVRSYKLARKGISVELKPKQVNITRLEVEQLSEKSFKFFISCSSGTYIRSICRDIAQEAGSLATMTELKRVQSGSFIIDDALELDSLTRNRIEDNIISIESVFPQFPIVEIDETSYNKIANGLTCVVKDKDGIVFVKNGVRLLGVGEIKDFNLKLVSYLAD